jgi:hypothetical protein
MKMRRTTVVIVGLSLAVLLAVGCAEFLGRRRSAWDNLFRDNNPEDTAGILGRISAPRAQTEPANRLRRPLLAAVKLGTPPFLFVHDLSAGTTVWEREVGEIASRPLILDDLVVFVVGREVLAWDLATGAERWRYGMPEGWTFRGAAVENGRAYVTIGKGRLGSVQRRDGRIVCLEAASGRSLWVHEVPFLLAAPAAADNLVYVPWDGQNMTVLDGTTGNEICRLRSLDDVINFAIARPEGVFYGGRGLYRLTDRSPNGRRDAATYFAMPLTDVPGDPEFELSGFELPSLSMRKIRFYWQAVPTADASQFAMTDNAIYLLYFRFILAFDSQSGQLRWAYRFNEDVEGVDVVPGGIFLMGRHGVLTFVGAESGSVEWSAELGVRIRSVTFSMGGFQPPARVIPGPPNVRQRLQEIIFDPDNRLLPVRTYALHLLTTVEDPEVTQDLLQVASREGVPVQLREAAAQALAGRETGAAFLIDALSIHNDFLAQSQTVPLNIVAPTLVRMSASDAVPALLEHMMDHETSLTDLREVVAAIVALGDASVVGPLRDFLVRYHKDSAFAQGVEALGVIVDGLLRHGDIAERELLERMRDDPQAIAPLREHITASFAALEAAAQPETPVTPEVPEDTGPTPEQVCAQQRTEHYELTQDEINEVMRAHAAGLRDCFMAEMERNPEAGQVRIVFLITDQGTGINWDVIPQSTELMECLRPQLEAVRFPCIRAYRQRARFGVILSRPRAPEPPPQTPTPPPPVQPGGWGPPPPSAVTTPDAGAPPPTEYPDQYPDELPK